MNSPFAKLLLTTFSVLALGTAGAGATVIANETALTGTGGYTTGGAIFGQNSSSAVGFSGNWTGTGTTWIQAQSANLAFAGLTGNTGGSLFVTPSNNGDFSKASFHAFTSTAGQGSLWFGTLFKTDANTLSTGTTAMAGFLSGTLPTSSASSSTGAVWSSANGGTLGGFAWGMSGGNLTVAYQSAAGGSGAVTLANTGFTVTAGTTYLLLAQLTLNATGNDVLNVWAETSLPASQAALGTPTWSVSADIVSASGNLNTLALYGGVTLGSGVANTNTLDDITVATSFNDIVPVPEPRSVLGLALGLLLLAPLALRRRLAVG